MGRHAECLFDGGVWYVGIVAAVGGALGPGDGRGAGGGEPVKLMFEDGDEVRAQAGPRHGDAPRTEGYVLGDAPRTDGYVLGEVRMGGCSVSYVLGEVRMAGCSVSYVLGEVRMAGCSVRLFFLSCVCLYKRWPTTCL